MNAAAALLHAKCGIRWSMVIRGSILTHGNDLPRKISGEMNLFMETMSIRRVDHVFGRIRAFKHSEKESRGFLQKKERAR
jgi:hypothetical protein